MRNRRIRLADHRGRDATVVLVPVVERVQRCVKGNDGRPVRHVRRVRSTRDTNIDALTARWPDPEEFSRALIDGDPGLDFAITGRATGPCDRVHFDGDGAVIYAPAIMEVQFSPDGLERERRPIVTRPANLVTAAPPVWSGVLIPRDQVVRRYALMRAYQVAHTNALEFDFLHGLAAHLDERIAMARVGSGRHGKGPLIFERNGPTYRGFLDGRVQGDAMRLVLYLAAFELVTQEVRS